MPAYQDAGLAYQSDGFAYQDGDNPPFLVGDIPNIRRAFNTGTHQFDLSQYFSGADTYSIAPSGETGWSFDTNTGVLTIDTDVLGLFGPYVITATNVNGTEDSNGFTVEVYVADSGAGRPKRRQRRLSVEIDGQEFEVGTEAEARALLERARTLAEQHAQQATQREQKRSRRRKQAVRTVSVPVISTPDPEIQPLVDSYRADIEAIYQRMQRDAEIRELIRLKLIQEDEDDALAALLLH